MRTTEKLTDEEIIFIEKHHSHIPWEAVQAYCDFGSDWSEWDEDTDQERVEYIVNDISERYEGYFKDHEDFAKRLAYDIYEKNTIDQFTDYIDWESYASDLFDYDYCWYDGYVFRNF